MSEDLRRAEETIQKLKSKLQEQDEFLEKLTQPPFGYGIVIKTHGDTMTLSAGGNFMEVPNSKKYKPSDIVRIHMETGVPVGKIDHWLPTGNIHVVRRVHDGGPFSDFIEIESDSGSSTVYKGKFTTAEVGDRIVMDNTRSVILANLGKAEEKFSFEGETHVSWEDIGGLYEAKKQMIEAIEMPHMHPKVFERYGQKPSKGVLLYGPPGCGKTMLAKATVSSLAKHHGSKTTRTGFIYVKGPEILSKWVGEAEATIRSIFLQAREHFKQHNYPAVIFIDEADAIFGRRGSGKSADVERTIVPQFLAEMDGLQTHGQPVVLLATNRPDTLDSAVVRDGRIDKKVRVTRPNKTESEDIFKIHLRGRPKKDEAAALIKHGASELYSDKYKLYRISRNSAPDSFVTLGDLVNGAMINGIIGIATMTAMYRELKSTKNNRTDGLTMADITDAIKQTVWQNRDLGHVEELGEIIHPYKDDVVDISKVAA